MGLAPAPDRTFTEGIVTTRFPPLERLSVTRDTFVSILELGENDNDHHFDAEHVVAPAELTASEHQLLMYVWMSILQSKDQLGRCQYWQDEVSSALRRVVRCSQTYVHRQQPAPLRCSLNALLLTACPCVYPRGQQ